MTAVVHQCRAPQDDSHLTPTASDVLVRECDLLCGPFMGIKKIKCILIEEVILKYVKKDI